MLNVVKRVEDERDKLVNFRPALFTAIFLVLGILFGYYTFIDGLSMWWLFLLLPIGIVPLFFCENWTEIFKRALVIALLVATFFLGFVCFRYQLYDYVRCGYYDGQHTVTGTVINCAEGDTSVKVYLRDISVDGEEEKGVLIAYLPASSAKNIRVADILVIEGTVRTKTDYLNGSFPVYSINDGVRFSASQVTAYQRTGSSKDIFLLARDRIERVVCYGMDETSASVVLGILTGNTAKIEEELLDNMRMGGIAHIFAVSGLHVGALYAFMLLLFSKTQLKKTNGVVKFIFLSTTLLFYAGVCGFSPSIVRAITLCLVSYVMRRLGGSTDGLNTLGVAAILILLWRPCALFETGFQLSFSACFGILLFSKRIGYVCDEGYKFYRKLYPRQYTEEEKKLLDKGDTIPLTVGERFYRAFVSVLSASLSAQLLTAPIQYLAFGYLSGWAFILNLIFVPLLGVAFAALLLVVIVVCLLPLWCSSYLLYIPAMLFNALLLVFEVVDFSSFAFVGMQLSGASCVCYYGGIIFFTDKWNLSRHQRICLSGACFLAFAIILALLNL